MGKKKERKPEKAFWIYCRSCGCEYLEPKDWFEFDHRTGCPSCGNILTI